MNRLCSDSIPNITGYIDLGVWQSAYGALYKKENKKGVAYDDSTANTIGFDAGKSTEIYGKSNTVQPPAFQTLIIIKV